MNYKFFERNYFKNGIKFEKLKKNENKNYDS